MANQPIDSPNETRVDGARAKREAYSSGNESKGSAPMDRMYGSGEDGQVTSPTGKVSGGYVGAVGELERNNDVRHPSSKIWVRRDRKPDDYLHTGNG